jgi:hypothetical protein
VLPHLRDLCGVIVDRVCHSSARNALGVPQQKFVEQAPPKLLQAPSPAAVLGRSRALSRRIFPAAAEFVRPHDPVKRCAFACAASVGMSQ